MKLALVIVLLGLLTEAGLFVYRAAQVRVRKQVLAECHALADQARAAEQARAIAVCRTVALEARCAPSETDAAIQKTIADTSELIAKALSDPVAS